jgi:PKD repeat protein
MRTRSIAVPDELRGPTPWLAAAMLGVALLSLISLGLHAKTARPGPSGHRDGLSVEIFQPEYLSLQEGGVLTVRVTAQQAQKVATSFSLVASDGGPTADLGSALVTLNRGANDIGVVVPPEALVNLAPGDAVSLVAWAGGRSAVMETTVRCGAATSALSAWSIAFASSPLQISSVSDQHVSLSVTNPKRAEKQGRITLKFLDASMRPVGTVSEGVSLSPGTNEESVDVSRAMSSSAKAAAARSATAILKVGGVIRATASVPVVFDGASPLSASASGTPLSGSAPLTVAFTGSASGGTPPYTYDWNFGDGSAHGTAENPSHVYSTAGSYSASLTVKDATIATASSSAISITVGTVPTPLSASASGTPRSGTAPLNVAFTGGASGGTPPYTYDWNFGDGSAHGTAQGPSHVYSAAGSYSASLTVKDATNATATSSAISIVVSATPLPLSASASAAPLSGAAPLTVAFTGGASGGTGPYTYDWNFGDGSAHGSAQSPSHVYTVAGSYSASLTVRDASNATATSSAISVSVTAGGGGPSLSAIQTSLFTPRCSGCHGGSNPRAGMNLSAGQAYSNLVNVVSTTNPPMLRVKPGDPANSFIVVQLASGHMGVSASDQQAIKDWISAGAPNN